jgi:hypothetical protein
VNRARSGNLRAGIGSSPRSVAAAAAAAAAASAAAAAAAARVSQTESAVTSGLGISPSPSGDMDALGVASTERRSNPQVGGLGLCCGGVPTGCFLTAGLWRDAGIEPAAYS